VTGSGEEAALIEVTATRVAEVLDDTECRRLLATVGFGRLVFTREALPAVQLMRFWLRGDQILLPTHEGSKLSRAVRGAVVAFQADYLDPRTKTGWTVSTVGPAHVLTEPDEIAAAEDLGLQTWLPSAPYSYVAVEIGILYGYRVLPAPDQAFPSAPIDVLPYS
jgi:hypothetical protein